jgi:photosystem II stability/assembly factor-like uncharacterized protein
MIVGTPVKAAEATWSATLVGKTTTWTGTELFPDGTAYSTASENVLYKSEDGGSTWIPLMGPADADQIGRMSFSSPEVGFVSSGEKVYRTIDGGSTWETLPPLPVPAGASENPSVDGLEAIPGTRSVLVSGWTVRGVGCEMYRTDHSVLRLVNGRWRERYLSYPASVYEIEFLNRSDGLVLAHKFEIVARGGDCSYASRTTRSFVLLTRDGGKTFKKLDESIFVDEDPVMAVAMPTRDRIIFGTRGGDIYSSKNGGRTFRFSEGIKGMSPTGGELDALDFSTGLVGYAGTNGTGIWRATDGGRSWVLEPSPFESARVVTESGTYRGSISAVGKTKAVASGPGGVARRQP